MTRISALYPGKVVHARHRPRAHKLGYSVFSMLVDLDELPELDRTLRLFGHNRRAVFSIHDADHGLGREGELRVWVEDHLRDAGIRVEAPRIRMLCYPRIFGHVFNPLTVYFCSDRAGTLRAVLYEVCNTFHERHTYIIPVKPGSTGAIRQTAPKLMYVSPFMPMECTYHFKIEAPDDRVLVAINETDAEGPLLYASFAGRRATLSDGRLLRYLFTYPLMTLKVVAGIHWEALKLWGKGVPVHAHVPAAQPIASTVVTQPPLVVPAE
jgi:uncharacterized protein